jgi:hypothetical protein
MRFTTLAVLAVVAPLSTAFAPSANQRQFTSNHAFVRTSSAGARRGAMSMDLSDLENKATSVKLGPVSDKPAPKKESPKPAPKPAPKPEPEKKAKKSKKEPEPEPAPKPAPEPKAAKLTGSGKYDFAEEKSAKTKKEKAAPAPKEAKVKAPPAPKAPKAPKAAVSKVVKAPAAPKPVVVSDPLAKPAGIALGAAPLLLAPIAILGAARGALTGTVARREKIQAEIAAAEIAKKKKQRDAQVDGGGIATAAVSI